MGKFFTFYVNGFFLSEKENTRGKKKWSALK